MANVDGAFGLRPVGTTVGAPYTGPVEMMYLPTGETNAIFIGSPVKSGGSADSDGVPSITLAAAADAIVGVVVGFKANADNLAQQYRPASQERYAFVATDPNAVFECQDDAVGATLAAADVGLNANRTAESGSTVFGTSTVELDTSSKGTETSKSMRILAVTRRPDNSIGANAIVRVMANLHERRASIAGV